jgi:apolipoprotein N-acyltransferase
LGPVILIALVPLFDAVRRAEAAPVGERRRASGLCYLGAVLQFAVVLYWILFLPPEEVTVPGLVILGFAILCGYLGLFIFGAMAAARRGARMGIPLWLGLPVAWIAGEYLRSVTQLAFPWALAGYGLIETPVVLQFLSSTGIFGGSLLVLLVNGLVHAAFIQRGWQRLAPAGLAVALVGGAWAHGRWVIARLPAAPAVEVLIVQGNIGRAIKFKPEYRRRNVERMIELSEQGLARGASLPALIIWPETAAPCYLKLDSECRGLLTEFVDRAGVPLLTGAPDVESFPDGSQRHTNAALLIAPGKGLVAQYDKVNLVPFGEAIPYQDRWPQLAAINFGEADFHRGRGFVPITSGDQAFGVMICFESVFHRVGRAYAQEGATFFVNITNDEWFGRSGGPYQHAAMAAARSIENRRGLARAANTGVSFVVDRAGRVSHATPLFTEAVVRAPVELGTEKTLAIKVGDLLPWICLAVTGVMAVLGHRRAPAPIRPGDGVV